jgi:hypothetical protein
MLTFEEYTALAELLKKFVQDEQTRVDSQKSDVPWWAHEGMLKQMMKLERTRQIAELRADQAKLKLELRTEGK